MRIIEKHQGCPVDPKAPAQCWGPEGTYWTVFGTEVRFLKPHLIASIFMGVLILSGLRYIDRRESTSIPTWLQFTISLLSIPISFLTLAYLFPVQVLY